MSKLADQLRAIRVFNNWELLRKFGDGGHFAVEYAAAPRGRLGYASVSGTRVWSPRPHPELTRVQFADVCERVFVGRRAATWETGLSWARATSGCDYAPSPFGGWVPLPVLERARAAVK